MSFFTKIGANLRDRHRPSGLHLWPRSVSSRQLGAISNPQFTENAHLSSLRLRLLSWQPIAKQQGLGRLVLQRHEYLGNRRG